MADEAAPPERGVELDERPQLRLVAPHPREEHRHAPRLPRRRRSRRPVEPPAAAGPHGLRPPARRSARSATSAEERRIGARVCAVPLPFWWRWRLEETGTGTGRGGSLARLVVWFVADFYFPFFLFHFGGIYRSAFSEVFVRGVCLCGMRGEISSVRVVNANLRGLV